MEGEYCHCDYCKVFLITLVIHLIENTFAKIANEKIDNFTTGILLLLVVLIFVQLEEKLANIRKHLNPLMALTASALLKRGKERMVVLTRDDISYHLTRKTFADHC